MAICRPEAIDAAPVRGPEQSGGWRRDDFLAARGMGEAQGKKVEPPPLRLRRSRRSRPLARSAKERPWVARRTASSGEVVANLKGPAQEDWHTGRTDGGHSVEKRRHHPSSTDRRQRPSPASCRLARGKASRSGHSGIRSPVASRQAFAATISANLFDDGETKASAPLIVQPPVSRQISAPRAPPVRRRSQQCQSREGRAP